MNIIEEISKINIKNDKNKTQEINELLNDYDYKQKKSILKKYNHIIEFNMMNFIFNIMFDICIFAYIICNYNLKLNYILTIYGVINIIYNLWIFNDYMLYKKHKINN